MYIDATRKAKCHFFSIMANSCVSPGSSGHVLRQGSIGFGKISELARDEKCPREYIIFVCVAQDKLGGSPKNDCSTGLSCQEMLKWLSESVHWLQLVSWDVVMVSTSKGRCQWHQDRFVTDISAVYL